MGSTDPRTPKKDTPNNVEESDIFMANAKIQSWPRSQLYFVQRTHKQWCAENFGDRESKLGAVALAHPLLCMAAAGRYAHSTLKADQGIRGEDDETLVAARMDNKAIASASDHNIDPAGVAALENVDRRSLQCAIGVFEEAGELVEAVAERDEEATLDAVGDVTLYLMDLCNRLDVDFEVEVAKVARKVHGRDWNEAPETGRTYFKGGDGQLERPDGVNSEIGVAGASGAPKAVRGFAVESSNVRAVAWHRYDEHVVRDGQKVSDALFVAFKGGKVYQYWGVSLGRAVGLTCAESVGRYLSEHIKGVYPYELDDRVVVQWDETITASAERGAIVGESKIDQHVERRFREWNGLVDE